MTWMLFLVGLDGLFVFFLDDVFGFVAFGWVFARY